MKRDAVRWPARTEIYSCGVRLTNTDREGWECRARAILFSVEEKNQSRLCCE